MAQKAYLGTAWILSIILAIIPVTNIVLGIVTRFQRDKILLGILNIIPILWIVFYIVDLISIIANKDLKWLA